MPRRSNSLIREDPTIRGGVYRLTLQTQPRFHRFVYSLSNMNSRADNALRNVFAMCRLCLIDEEQIPLPRRLH